MKFSKTFIDNVALAFKTCNALTEENERLKARAEAAESARCLGAQAANWRSRAMTMRYEVTIQYAVPSGRNIGVSPMNDAAANHAAGRHCDFAGSGFGGRDMGWNCASEIEAHRIAASLKKIGLEPKTREVKP